MNYNNNKINKVYYGDNEIVTTKIVETGTASIDVGENGLKFGYSTFTEIPSIFDFSNVTDMEGMFSYCYSLTSVPEFDTSKVINMEGAFRNTQSLNSIPQFDTSNVKYMSFLFYYSNITTIPELNCESVDSMSNAFYNCKQLSYVGGFKNLGKYQSITEYQNVVNVWLPNSNLLTYESCMNIINNVYDMTSFDYRHVATIKFHATPYSLLSTSDIAIATNKGWTVTTA